MGFEFSASGVFLAVAVLICTYMLWRKQHRSMGYPDGPFNFPVFGNLFQVILAKSIPNFINDNWKSYGNVYTIELGGTKRVVISGFDNVYSLLVKNADCTSDRSPASMPPQIQNAVRSSPGLLWSPFPHWKTLRTFALQTLRDKGMGKTLLEQKIREEIDFFCVGFLDRHINEPFNFALPLCKATNNIISEMIFGGRNNYDDPKFDHLIRMLDKSITMASRAAITKNIPFMKHFGLSGLKESNAASRITLGEMSKRVADHKAKLNVENPKDIFDLYLCHQQSLTDEEQTGVFSDENAAVMGIQLYAAGTETTATALRWAFLYSCSCPNVLEKVQLEIMENIGNEKPPSFSDRINLPYTESVLLETLRLANISSTALPHLLKKTMEVDGQIIPAGSDLLLNMASILHDENVFEEPLRFMPERYLYGDVKLKKQRTLPFSIGRRVCLGESLARMELFLFYVTILQRYNVRLADDYRNLSFDPVVGLVSVPQQYELIFTRI